MRIHVTNTDIYLLQVTKGALAARNADANSIRTGIFTLSHADAKKRGWSMPATIEKSNCGIKSKCTALFLLPFQERVKYLEDPAVYVFRVHYFILSNN